MTTPAAIVKKMRPQCRHCHRHLNLSEVLEEMFKHIAERLDSGERIELPGIGVLRAKRVANRWIKVVPARVRKLVPGWVEVNFRAAADLKRYLNRNRPTTVEPPKEQHAKRKPAAGKPTAKRKRRRATPGKDHG